MAIQQLQSHAFITFEVIQWSFFYERGPRFGEVRMWRHKAQVTGGDFVHIDLAGYDCRLESHSPQRYPQLKDFR